MTHLTKAWDTLDQMVERGEIKLSATKISATRRTLYRVENLRMEGIYVNGTASVIGIRDGFHGRHPSPFEDSALMADLENKGLPSPTNREWRYGFASLDQLRNWLYKAEWRSTLAFHGFFISIIDVSNLDCAIGDTQAMMRNFTRAGQLDIRSL